MAERINPSTIADQFLGAVRRNFDELKNGFKSVEVAAPEEPQARQERPTVSSTPTSESSEDYRAAAESADSDLSDLLSFMAASTEKEEEKKAEKKAKEAAAVVAPDLDGLKSKAIRTAWDEVAMNQPVVKALPMTREESVYRSLSPEVQESLNSLGANPVRMANERINAENNAISNELSDDTGKTRQEKQDESIDALRKRTEAKQERERKQREDDAKYGARTIIDETGSVRRPGEIWEILKDTMKPRTITVNESGESTVEYEEPKRQKLLPGRIMRKVYKIPESLLKKQKGKKISEDKIIDKAMGATSILPMFENAVDFSTRKPSYNKDYNAGKRDYGQYDTRTKEQVARDEAIKKQLEWIGKAFIPLESQKIGKDGYIEWDPYTEQRMDDFMNRMRYAPEDRWLMFHQVAKRLGYTPDRNGKFLLQDSNKVPDSLFIEALDDIMASQAAYGHPYKMMDTRQHKYGGTKCFPIGVMTIEEAEILCASGGICEGRNPWDLVTEVRNDFVNFTLPEIRKEAYSKDGGVSQLIVIEDFIRALCSLDGQSPRIYNVAETIDRGYEELMAETDPSLNPAVDPEVQAERRQRLQTAAKRRDRAKQKFDRSRNRVKRYYKADVVDPETGEIIHKRGERVGQENCIDGSTRMELRSSRLQPFDSFCTFTANWAKFMGVIGFAPVIISGYAEHFSGNINTSITNKVMGKLFDMVGKNGEAYRPTKYMYEKMRTKEAVDAITAWKALLRTGGQEAVMLFYTQYKELTPENARKFLSEDVNKESLFKGALAQKAKMIARKASDGLALLMPGDVGFGRTDAARWLEGLMINNQLNASHGDQFERSFTSREIMEMMDSMGMARFIGAMTETIAGRDAAVMMRNSTLARESPLTHVCDMILRKSGLTNMLVTLGVDTYFTYGLNLMQAMLPFTNTFSYCVVRGINLAKTGGVKNKEQLDLNILEYQIGNVDSFGQGLVKNLLYDFVKLGNIGIFGCLTAAVFMALGFDEPIDEDNKYNWQEYRIGRNIGLGGVDENGEPQGIPIYRAWWLDDLTLFGLPLAYAICAHATEQKLGDNDPNLAWRIFDSACFDVVSGASLFDLIRSIKNAKETIVAYDDLLSEPDSLVDPNFLSYMWMEFIELPLARAANKLVMPNFLRDMYKGEYDHSAYEVYNRSSSTPGKTKPVESWEELQRRIESRNNIPYAYFNNLIHNGYWTDDGTTQRTGYRFDEMPLAGMKDPLRMTFMEELNYNPDSQPVEDLPEYNDKKCEELIAMIDGFGDNVDIALQNGFMIPWDLRIEFSKYCLRRQNYVTNHYNELIQNGISGAAREDAWTQKENDYAYYKHLLNDWVWNSDIPWSDIGYVKLRTDTEPVYTYRNTGKPASSTDYVRLGPLVIDKHYVPKGNTPNSFMPFTSPNTAGTGYNYETVPEWYGNRTDIDKIFEWADGKIVPHGTFEGVSLRNAIFGGNPDFKTDTDKPIESDEYKAYMMNDIKATIGRRGYVAFDEAMLKDLPNYNPDTFTGALISTLKENITRENVDGGTLGEDGEYKDPDDTSSSKTANGGSSKIGGGSYSSSSRKSYSSMPKVYSTSRSINPDKAATMYSKQLKDSRTTYLSPGFATKGSREAYRRQDI